MSEISINKDSGLIPKEKNTNFGFYHPTFMKLKIKIVDEVQK